MSVPVQHIIHQTSVVASLGSTTWRSVLQRLGLGAPGESPLPGPEIKARIAPRSPALVRDYVRHVGGDPDAYRQTVPAHFFPQWSLPLAARTLDHVRYPLLKIMNGGCRLQIRAPLLLQEAFEVSARLESIEDDGRRAVLRQRIVTGTLAHPSALTADLYAIVPSSPRGPAPGPDGLGARRGANTDGSARKEAARVPDAARELRRFELGPSAGLDFAMLTGDFNPIHWLGPYARAFGFGGPILHGFATMARAMEGLYRDLFAGAVDRIRVFDVRFTRPLRLPANVGLFVQDNRCFVGDAVGGLAYLVGEIETETSRQDPS